MKHLKLIPILAPLVIAACAPIVPTCGGQALATGTIYTKEGFPIIIEPPLSAPCPTVAPPNVSTPPVSIPPVLPPVEPPVKGNNGFGNRDQDAPGRSEFRNRAENAGGNRNGRRASPGRSWHDA